MLTDEPNPLRQGLIVDEGYNLIAIDWRKPSGLCRDHVQSGTYPLVPARSRYRQVSFLEPFRRLFENLPGGIARTNELPDPPGDRRNDFLRSL